MISIKSIKPLKRQFSTNDEIPFEITLDTELDNQDVEFSVVYCGDPEKEEYDQVLSEDVVGPLSKGRFGFTITATPVDIMRIPAERVFGVTSIVIVGKYKGREFVRAGFFVNVSYPGLPNRLLEFLDFREENEMSLVSSVEEVEKFGKFEDEEINSDDLKYESSELESITGEGNEGDEGIGSDAGDEEDDDDEGEEGDDDEEGEEGDDDEGDDEGIESDEKDGGEDNNDEDDEGSDEDGALEQSGGEDDEGSDEDNDEDEKMKGGEETLETVNENDAKQKRDAKIENMKKIKTAKSEKPLAEDRVPEEEDISIFLQNPDFTDGDKIPIENQIKLKGFVLDKDKVVFELSEPPLITVFNIENDEEPPVA